MAVPKSGGCELAGNNRWPRSGFQHIGRVDLLPTRQRQELLYLANLEAAYCLPITGADVAQSHVVHHTAFQLQAMPFLFHML